MLLDVRTSGPAEVVSRVLVCQEPDNGLHPFGRFCQGSRRKVGPITKAGGNRG